MNKIEKVSVVLPSLAPDEKLLGVIHGLIQQGFSQIILVDDGSKPENLHYFEKAAACPQVTLLHHEGNRGKGAALKTAFRWFLDNCPDGAGVVTVDGDGQHHCEDTVACARKMLESGKIVLGVRDFTGPEVPRRSRFGNQTTSAVFKIFVGMTISDTQTGLRAIPRQYLKRLCAVSGDRFEYETNMLLAMKEYYIPFVQQKIRTVYIEENKSSHFRAVQDSWRIYKLILAHFFKFIGSSFVASVVDEVLFVALTHCLGGWLDSFALTLVPFLVARVLSSLINFRMNQRLVFCSSQDSGKALLRYFYLAVPVALAQLGLTYGAYLLFHIGEEQVVFRGLIYAGVMVALFIFNFIIQQRWVFASDREDSKK